MVFSLNRNKVKSLDTANSSIEKTYQPSSTNYIVTKTVVGQPIGQLRGYKVIGRFDKPEDFYYHDAAGNLQQVAIPEGNTIARAQHGSETTSSRTATATARSTPKTAHSSATPNPNSHGASATLSTTKAST